MATIANLLVNLGMNSAAFDSGAKKARGSLRGIARDVEAAQRTISGLGRLAMGAFIGRSAISAIRSIVTEVESAAKTSQGLAKISKAYHVDPTSIVAATKSFRELEHTIKGVLIGALTELAPLMTSIARIVRQAAEGFAVFSRETFGSVGNVFRVVASCYALVKISAAVVAAINAIVRAKKAWVSITVLLQAVTGVGLKKALIGLGVGAAAVLALNLAFDKLVGSAGATQTELISFSQAQLDAASASKQLNVRLVEQASIADGIARRFAVAVNMARHGVSETIATLKALGASHEVIESAMREERAIARIETGRANKKSLDDMIARLKEQVFELKNSALAVELYRAKLLGASTGQLALIFTLHAQTQSLQFAKKAADQLSQAQDRMKAAGESLRKSLASPWESLIDRLKEVHEMLAAEAINAETFGRAVRGAMGEYARSVGRAFGTYRLGNPLISIESMKTGVGAKTAVNVLQELREAGKLDTGLFKRIAAAVEAPAA